MWDCYSNVKNNVENYTGTAYSFLGFGLNTMRPLDSDHDNIKRKLALNQYNNSMSHQLY